MYQRHLWACILLALPNLLACQSMKTALLDDDCKSNRLTFWNASDEIDTLPSPKLASLEAQEFLATRETMQPGSQQIANESDFYIEASDNDLEQLRNQIASILVPSYQESENFIPVKGQNFRAQDLPQGKRRRAIFGDGLQALQKETQKIHLALDSWGTQGQHSMTGSSPIMALSARSLPTKDSSGFSSYKVQAGDTLGSIARKIYGTSQRWLELAYINQLGDGSLIFPNELIFYRPN